MKFTFVKSGGPIPCAANPGKQETARRGIGWRIILGCLLLVMLALPVQALTAPQFGAYSDPTITAVGGGPGYANIVLPTNANIVSYAETPTQLINALAACPSGKIVFINKTVNINVSGSYQIAVPAGVTLASDRGNAGSPGGRISHLRLPNDIQISGDPKDVAVLYITGNNARITGLRIDGMNYTADATAPYENMTTGIALFNAKGLEVDNNEIYGWGYGVFSDMWSDAGSLVCTETPTQLCKNVLYLHHNYIHHNQQAEGYGVTGEMFGYGNYFDYERHAIADAGGYSYHSYQFSNNIFGGHFTDTIIDVHGANGTGGDSMKVYAGYKYVVDHNTFRQPPDSIYQSFAFQTRGVPLVGAYFYGNDARNTTYFTYSQNSPPTVQWGFGGYGNMTTWNNVISGAYNWSGQQPNRCPTADMWDYSCTGGY
jgi:hypothetical protein